MTSPSAAASKTATSGWAPLEEVRRDLEDVEAMDVEIVGIREGVKAMEAMEDAEGAKKREEGDRRAAGVVGAGRRGSCPGMRRWRNRQTRATERSDADAR